MKMYDPEIWFNETNGYEELLENIKASFAAKMKDNIKMCIRDRPGRAHLCHPYANP